MHCGFQVTSEKRVGRHPANRHHGACTAEFSLTMGWSRGLSPNRDAPKPSRSRTRKASGIWPVTQLPHSAARRGIPMQARRTRLRPGKMAPRAGFEPATQRLTAACSTTELPGIRGGVDIGAPLAGGQAQGGKADHPRDAGYDPSNVRQPEGNHRCPPPCPLSP